MLSEKCNTMPLDPKIHLRGILSIFLNDYIKICNSVFYCVIYMKLGM